MLCKSLTRNNNTGQLFWIHWLQLILESSQKTMVLSPTDTASFFGSTQRVERKKKQADCCTNTSNVGAEIFPVVLLYSDRGTPPCQNTLISTCSHCLQALIRCCFSSMSLWQKLVIRLASVRQCCTHWPKVGRFLLNLLIFGHCDPALKGDQQWPPMIHCFFYIQIKTCFYTKKVNTGYTLGTGFAEQLGLSESLALAAPFLTVFLNWNPIQSSINIARGVVHSSYSTL